MDTAPNIRVEHLHITLGDGLVVVHDLSFSIDAGKTLAIVGENGSGKSLTALALMGLLPSSATWTGTIQLNTLPVTSLTSETSEEVWTDMRGRVASMVSKEPGSALNPALKLGRQLAEAIQLNSGLNSNDAKASALEWMQRVNIPNPASTYHKYPSQASGAEIQRLLMAMAMCANPLLVVADEPTSTLDATEQKEIIQLLKELQLERGAALVFTTHDLLLASTIADDLVVIQEGHVMEHGPVAQVLSQPKEPYTLALLSCRPGHTEKDKRLPVSADFIEGVTIPEHHEISKPTLHTEVLLQVRHLRVWHPTQRNLFGTPVKFIRAIEDISFDLLKGEVLGITGEIGNGMSTISRTLMGLQEIESGTMIFEGQDLARLGPVGWRRMRRRIQTIFQGSLSLLNPDLTIGEIISEPLLAHNIVPRSELENETRRLLELVQLPTNVLTRFPGQFSLAQQHRIVIARALALKPGLIVCDEHLYLLDMPAQAELINVLRQLQAQLKLTYLFISHDMNVLHYMADKILVMQGGKIIERGSADQIFKHPEHEYTKSLVEATLTL